MKLVYAVLGMLISMVAGLFYALVFKLLWAWFVVDALGVRALSFYQAYGLLFLPSFFAVLSLKKPEEASEADGLDWVWLITLRSFLRVTTCAILLSMAYAAKEILLR
jgi:hypothetical protein